MSPHVRRLAWLSTGLLAFFAWVGYLFSDSLPEWWILVGVALVGYCLYRLYRSLGTDPGIPEADAEKLRSHILWLGPLGAIEVLLWRERVHS